MAAVVEAAEAATSAAAECRAADVFSRGGMGLGGARWSGANFNRSGNFNRAGNWNGRNWSGRNNWNGNNRHGNNWHGGNWHNGHHGHNHDGNDVIFIGGFGFPWWWGWGWGGGWGWDYGYPYGYYPYGYGGAYGYGDGGYPYGYGYGYNKVANMATATGLDSVLDTATAADPESPSCNGGCHAPAITMDPLTESWGRRRGAQSGLYEQEHDDAS